jgi:transposase InsO family protein
VSVAAESNTREEVQSHDRLKSLEANRPDLLEQNFSATVPNQKWTTDISYVWSDEGWLYLAVVMDLYSRAIVGWSMNRRMAQTSIFEYIETYYNRQRKHSAIGYRIPMLFDNAA